MALSANAIISRKDGVMQSYPVADNVHIYKGALVCVDTSGYARPAADTIGYRFVGVAMQECDNTLTGHSAGGKDVLVEGGRFLLPATSITQLMVGQMMYLVDDATIDDYAGCTNHVAVGKLDEYVSATSGWVNTFKREVISGTELSAMINCPAVPTNQSGLGIVAWAAAAHNELGVSAYFETHLTGTVSGTVYGMGSWINLEAAVVCGGNMIVAQDNGIYGPAGLTISSAKMIIGMRMELVIDDGANPGSLFLFSTNIYDNALTAMFDINAAADFGWITGAATTTTTGHFPFIKCASSGETYYVNVYTGG